MCVYLYQYRILDGAFLYHNFFWDTINDFMMPSNFRLLFIFSEQILYEH